MQAQPQRSAQQAVVLGDEPALPSCRCKITKPVEPTILLGKRVSIRWDKHEKLDGVPTLTHTWHTGVVTSFRNADCKHQVRAHHQHQQGGCSQERSAARTAGWPMQGAPICAARVPTCLLTYAPACLLQVEYDSWDGEVPQELRIGLDAPVDADLPHDPNRASRGLLEKLLALLLLEVEGLGNVLMQLPKHAAARQKASTKRESPSCLECLSVSCLPACPPAAAVKVWRGAAQAQQAPNASSSP